MSRNVEVTQPLGVRETSALSFNHVRQLGNEQNERCVSEACREHVTSIQFICIAQFHKLQICLGVLYNLYT